MTHLVQALRVAGIEARPAGDELRICCPSCGDVKYKLYINPTKRVSFCFRCQRSYNLEGLRILLGLREPQLSVEIDDAIRALRALQEEPSNGCEERWADWPREAVPAWTVTAAKTYLRKRGIGLATMQAYAMHYCPTGPFEGRILIPVFGPQGRFQYFAGRAIDDRKPTWRYPANVPRSHVLFPGDRRLLTGSLQEPRVLVEGMFDAIHLEGLAQAMGGLLLSPEQVRVLHQDGVEAIAFLYDADVMRPTHPAHAKLMERVHALTAEFRVKLVVLREGDPDEYPVPTLRKWIRATPWLQSPEAAGAAVAAMQGRAESDEERRR